MIRRIATGHEKAQYRHSGFETGEMIIFRFALNIY
jgi:hypothetical protein